MKILNILNRKSELQIPLWVTLFFLAEWICNPQIEFKPFIGGFILLTGAIQSTPESKLSQWLNYSFRALLVIAILIVSHEKEFLSALKKLGI